MLFCLLHIQKGFKKLKESENSHLQQHNSAYLSLCQDDPSKTFSSRRLPNLIENHI
jgi:hypothetical protein